MDPALDRRLKLLMLMRLVMVTTLLLVAVYVEAVSENLLAINPLYFLIVCTYGLTVIHALALRFVHRPVPLVFAQVMGDLLITTGLVYVTGGVRTGFMLLYPISVLSGAVLLYRRAGMVFAGLATLCYAAIVWAVREGWVPHQGLSDVPYLSSKALVYSIFVTAVACTTVALIGSYLSESLKSVGRRLEETAEQMADLEELNKVIVRSIHSGLITADAAGHVLYLNEFGAGILRRRVADVRGRPLSEVFRSRLFDAAALSARTAGRELERLDLPYTRADGSLAALGVSISPLTDAWPGTGGGGHLLIFQDLTDIKRLEQDVRTKEKLAAVGEMAAQLAHEIRNPLGSISGSAQILMGEAGISPEQERLLAIIRRESQRLSDALNQFLYQARPARPPAGPVDLRPVLEEAVTLLRNGPEVSPAHRVEFEAEEGPLLCRVDPDRITQVFWNLARNGLEAMPDGGLLSVRLGRQDHDLVLTIRDEGRGMAEAQMRRMFEPFQSQRPLGTGLGLAIVYHIVREQRGDITVQSTPAQGTEVKVRLPLVPVPAAVDRAAAPR
jgi:two-component system, NtrC family, sensor histidine kinase PilS